jgi:hypothetical protein
MNRVMGISSKRVVRVVLVLLAAAFVLHAGNVLAASACNRATLNGSYGLLGWGAGSDVATSYAAVGIETFDGVGNVSARFNQNPFGTASCLGRYVVHADCTASETFTGAGCDPNPFPMTVVSNGTKVFMKAPNIQFPYAFVLERIH